MTDNDPNGLGQGDSGFRRGSTWRKWDLHIHSPLSILNNQFPKASDGTPDWEPFLAALEALDIAVLGITDYFTIEGYKKLREFQRHGRLKNIHTILPNIEFRLDKIIASKKDGKQPRRLNFHVIFSDEVDPKDIEEHFLHNLDFFFEGKPGEDDWKEKLKVSNLEALGRKLKEQHAPFRESGDSELKIGAGQAVVSHEQITKELQSPRFKGKYLLVFPEELSNLISWDGQDHHTRKGLLQKSAMVFSAQDQTIAWCLGRVPYAEGPEKFLDEFKTFKPCIHGSDAHRLDEIGRPCAKRGQPGHDCAKQEDRCDLRFCWIKADPTFEGLKQLIYEPAERVRIQPEDPSPIRSTFTIDSIALSQAQINADLAIAKSDIPLNPGLVAITGAKGSGKTALADLIANCYRDRSSTEDRNSFVWRIADDNPDFTTSLRYRDGTVFSKRVLEKTFFEDSDLVYIAQGELERYVDDKSDFEHYVRQLILDNPEISNSVKGFEFEELRGALDGIHRQLKQANKQIAALEEATGIVAAGQLEHQKKQKESDLKDVQARIQEVQRHLNPERLQEAEAKQRLLAEHKTRKASLSKLQEALDRAIEFAETDIPAFNAVLDEIRVLFAEMNITTTVANLAYPDTPKLKASRKTVQADLRSAVEKIETTQKDIDLHASEVRDHAKLLDKKAELEKAVAHLKQQEVKLGEDRSKLAHTLGARTDGLKKQVATVIEQAEKYQELIALFSSQRTEILGDLSFEAQVTFDAERFLQGARDVLDNRRISVMGDGGESEFAKILRIAAAVGRGNPATAEEYVAEIVRLTGLCKSRLKQSQAISPATLYDFLYGHYFGVSAVVRYKNTDLRKLSLGQKATVLIKIHLAQGDRPIIIDSHDDHLDNEFIMEELVKALRHAKQFRQIILASNNGNVVINSDADQIVFARRSGGTISYTAGSIEDPEIRDAAIKVLEGGKEAFRQRQQKYRLSPADQ